MKMNTVFVLRNLRKLLDGNFDLTWEKSTSSFIGNGTSLNIKKMRTEGLKQRNTNRLLKSF